MAKEYRLLSVKPKNVYFTGDSTEFIAEYEWRRTRKKYFLFGKLVTKTWLDKATFNVHDHRVAKWLDDMDIKINVWRTIK
jgi:hypothetical protein